MKTYKVWQSCILVLQWLKVKKLANIFVYPIIKKLDLLVWRGKGIGLLSRILSKKIRKKGFFQSNNTEIQIFYDRHSPIAIIKVPLIKDCLYSVLTPMPFLKDYYPMKEVVANATTKVCSLKEILIARSFHGCKNETK